MNKTFGAAIPDQSADKIILYLHAHYAVDSHHLVIAVCLDSEQRNRADGRGEHGHKITRSSSGAARVTSGLLTIRPLVDSAVGAPIFVPAHAYFFSNSESQFTMSVSSAVDCSNV